MKLPKKIELLEFCGDDHVHFHLLFYVDIMAVCLPGPFSHHFDPLEGKTSI